MRKIELLTGRDFSRIIGREILGDGISRIDGEEGRLAALLLRRRECVRRDPAVERPRGQECIDLLGLGRLRHFVGRELRDLDLGGIDAVLAQDDVQQVHVGRGLADDADAAAGEILDLLDRRTLRLLAFAGGRNPEHHKVLAHDGDARGVLRHIEVTADHGEVDALVLEGVRAGTRIFRRDDLQADIAALAREGVGQRLDHLDVLAVRRSDGDLQRHRAHGDIDRAHHHQHDGQRRRQRHEDAGALGGTFSTQRRWTCNSFTRAAQRRRPRKHLLEVQVHP